MDSWGTCMSSISLPDPPPYFLALMPHLLLWISFPFVPGYQNSPAQILWSGPTFQILSTISLSGQVSLSTYSLKLLVFPARVCVYCSLTLQLKLWLYFMGYFLKNWLGACSFKPLKGLIEDSGMESICFSRFISPWIPCSRNQSVGVLSSRFWVTSLCFQCREGTVQGF